MPVREIFPLMPVFDAILSEGNLSRAAARLGVSQSAVSQALSKLRKLSGDELFESTGRGVHPTPRALEMATHVRAALAHASAVLAPKAINVSTLQRTFTLDIGGGFDAFVLPPVANVLSEMAPCVRIVISNSRGSDLMRELKYGETEIAIDFQQSDSEEIRSQLLGYSTAVVITRRSNPALRRGLTREAYIKTPQVALAWSRSTVSGVSLGQARQHIQPRIVLTVPTLQTLGAVVETSDFIATTSAAAASFLAERYELEILPLPIRFVQLALYQLWHSRFDGDAGHRWLRMLIKAQCERAIKRYAST
jgi:LysR family transcriptional regulator, mexEF-oprN operon transcriptional activator